MAPSVAVLFVILHVSICMEMRETVERMVMVRTTGSDLQPAATGYIYKKERDGPASVIKMGESEVMEHLSKMYEQPKSFAAPIPIAAGPFYTKEGETKSPALSSESKIIPVVENQDDDHDKIDGIATEDYEKIFGEYATDFGDDKSDFDDYLKSLGYFEDGVDHDNEDGKYYTHGQHVYGDQDGKGIENKHQYKKGGSGDYHSEKYEKYEITKDDGHKKNYAGGHGYDGNDNFRSGDNEGKTIDGIYKLFDNDEYKQGRGFYGGEAINGHFNKFNEGHVLDEGLGKGGSHVAGHDEGDFKKSDVRDEGSEEHGTASSAEGRDGQYYHGGFSDKGGKHDVRSYGYEIKH